MNVKRIKGKILPLAIGFAVLYWVIDSAMMTFVLREGAFIENMFSPDMDDIWMRSAAMSIIIAFGVYAQSAVAKRKLIDEELQRYSEHLEEMVKVRTKELEDSQEKLITAQRLVTLGQFSGSISHELRNPLGVIDSSAYYLKTKLKDADKKVQQHLDRIQSSVGSATAIIESLLNLTRMKEPQLGGTDLLAVTRDAITTSKVPSAVNVVRNFPRQMALVIADREQLRMAFKNIVKNALEAMDGKGTLTVAVQSTDEGHAEVSFTDTGPGIAAENLEKIFDPLFTTKATGIGFGLSIAKMIINKHSGMVEATSEPGKGATIILRLPLYKVYKEASKEE